MTTTKDSLILSKTKRLPDNLDFYHIFIFNKSGICIYRLSLTDAYQINEEQLISSYFTALMSFTKELVGSEIKSVEMTKNLKLVVVKKDSLYYILLCDTIENKTYILDLITQIHNFFHNYVKENEIHVDIEYISDPNLDISIEEIIKDYLSNEYDLFEEQKIINYLQELNYDDQINGIIFLTDLGQVIYSSLNNITLKKFLKEVEFRIKICNNNILKLFYTSKDKELIYSEYISDKYFIILIFDASVRFGVAEFYLQKIVKKIKVCLGL